MILIHLWHELVWIFKLARLWKKFFGFGINARKPFAALIFISKDDVF